MNSKKWLGLGLVGLLGMSGVGQAQDPPRPPGPPPVRTQEPPRDGLAQVARELAEIDKVLHDAMAAGDKEKVKALEDRKQQAMARLLEMANNDQRGPRRVDMPRQDGGGQELRDEMARLMDEMKMREMRGEPAPKEMMDRLAEMKRRLADSDAARNPGMGRPEPEMSPEELKRHQELMKMEREAGELGGQLRRTPADKKDERDEIKAKMSKVVAQLFDAREAARAKEVDDLKRRIEELTKLLQKRKESRDKIVERKIKQLSGEPDELDW